MAFKFNPLTGELDLTGTGTPALGTSTNPYPTTGWYAYNVSGTLYQITINSSGVLVTTAVSSGSGPNPFTWLNL